MTQLALFNPDDDDELPKEPDTPGGCAKRNTYGPRKARPGEPHPNPQHKHEIKSRRFILANYGCEACGGSCGDTRIDLHHNCYDRFGLERISDVIILCRTCHDILHEGWNRMRRAA